DSFPPEVLEKIIAKLPQQSRVALRMVSRRFNNIVQPFELQTLTLQMDHAIRSSKIIDRDDPDKATCFRRFAFPPTCNYSFFESTKIGHLEISKSNPIFIEDDNVEHLTALLSGCAVEKVTLVFDIRTIANLNKVPSFLSSLQAMHVVFALEKTMHYDMITPFLLDDFAAKLVSAGVREVSFSGEHVNGRVQEGRPQTEDHAWHLCDSPAFSFDLLLNFFEAGIKNITVYTKALEHLSKDISKEEFDSFLENLDRLAGPVRAELFLTRSSELWDPPNSRDGRYKRYDNDRAIVHVTTSTVKVPPTPRPAGYRQHVTIEYK
ncbi:hypothetical protein PENTCL1PPCAC_16283, partial [Pristionchus entomophagus]